MREKFKFYLSSYLGSRRFPREALSRRWIAGRSSGKRILRVDGQPSGSVFWMEVAEGIHLVECPWSTYFVSSCLIVGDGVAVIDAGTSGSPEAAIYPYLRGLGREPSEISHVLLTHAHHDHCGGVAPIKRETGCRVGVHELGRPYLEDPALIDRQLQERFPALFSDGMSDFDPVEVDIAFRDGDAIDLGGRALRVVHIPGHSACSSCLVDDELGVYICGDSVQGWGGRRPLLFHSSTEYTASMRRLLDEPMETLINGHPFPPFDKAVLRGDECPEHVRRSLAGAEELRRLVLGALEGAAEPMSIGQLHEGVGVSSPVTIGCILEALEREGRAERAGATEADLWILKK